MFKVVESLYKKVKYEYLPEELSVSIMHKMYSEWCAKYGHGSWKLQLLCKSVQWKAKKSPKKIPVINVKHSAIPPLQEEKRNEGYSPEAHPRKRSDKRSKGNSEVEC